MATIEAINQKLNMTIEIRQTKYLNNCIEQDHRLIKRIIYIFKLNYFYDRSG